MSFSTPLIIQNLPQQSSAPVILGPADWLRRPGWWRILAKLQSSAQVCLSGEVFVDGSQSCSSVGVIHGVGGGSTEVGEGREGGSVGGGGGGRASTGRRHVALDGRRWARWGLLLGGCASVRGRKGMSPSISRGSPCSSPGASSISQHFLYKDPAQLMFTSNLIGWQFKLLFPPKTVGNVRSIVSAGCNGNKTKTQTWSVCEVMRWDGLSTHSSTSRGTKLFSFFFSFCSFRELQQHNFQMELSPRSAKDERGQGAGWFARINVIDWRHEPFITLESLWGEKAFSCSIWPGDIQWNLIMMSYEGEWPWEVTMPSLTFSHLLRCPERARRGRYLQPSSPTTLLLSFYRIFLTPAPRGRPYEYECSGTTIYRIMWNRYCARPANYYDQQSSIWWSGVYVPWLVLLKSLRFLTSNYAELAHV